MRESELLDATSPKIYRSSGAFRTSVTVALLGAIVALLAFQAVVARRLITEPGFYSANLPSVVWLYVAFTGGIGVFAALLPRRWLVLLPILSWVGAAGVIFAAALWSGQLLSILMASATLGTAWLIGRFLLTGTPLRFASLGRAPIVSLALGYTTWSLVIFAIGIGGAIRWWNVGFATVGLGLGSAYVAIRQASVLRQVRSARSRLNNYVLSLAGLIAAYGAIWASAPDVQFDAVYGHVWLSQQWAESGQVGFTAVHPVANMFGSGYLIDVPGFLVGADDIGPWLQYFLAFIVAHGIWRLCKPYGGPYGAIAAIIFLLTPHVMWQISTANDDLALVMLVTGLVAALLMAASSGRGALIGAFSVGLLAGGVFSGKLHLAPFAVSAAMGWAVFAPCGSDGQTSLRLRFKRFALVAAGANLTAAPFLLARWAALGNPLFPQFNNIFKSPDFALVNARFNLPFADDSSLFALFRVPITISSSPDRLMEAVPPGIFGLLVIPLLAGPILGLFGSRRVVIASVSTLIALVAWWTQLRYLRYLLPYTAVGLILLGTTIGSVLARRMRLVNWVIAGTIGVTSILLFPSTLAAFWNIGERLPLRVAVGAEDRDGFESRYLPAADLSAAINRLSQPGSLTVGSAAYVRSALEDGRDASPDWEFGGRLSLNFPTPTTDVDEIYYRWGALGADMIAVDTGIRLANGYSSDAMSLLAERADLVWADRGLELYQLTSDPINSRALEGCSTRFAQGNDCWGVQLDRSPGLSPTESVDGARQTRRVCPGVTYQLNATSDGTTGGTRLEVLGFDQSGTLVGYARAELSPETSNFLSLTAATTSDRFEFVVTPVGDTIVSNVVLSATGASPECSREGG